VLIVAGVGVVCVVVAGYVVVNVDVLGDVTVRFPWFGEIEAWVCFSRKAFRALSIIACRLA